MNFGLIGAAGYIAPRHMQAIRDTENTLVAAVDPHDCVGLLDGYFPDARFFTEIERFDRFVEKRRRMGESKRLQYISICSPNYLHDAHIRMALRTQAHAICEKPLVISPWNLEALADLEEETGCRVYTVLQLRLLPSLIEIRDRILAQANGRADICLTYVTRRGRWYHVSWKGVQEKSGGIAMNIGIHFFDLLLWIFGRCQHSELHLQTTEKMAGLLELERARVRWFLSVDGDDLPDQARMAGQFAYRSMTLDGQEVEFNGFSDLHTQVYREILAGNGFGIMDAAPGIELVHSINRSAVVNSMPRHVHPMVESTPIIRSFQRRVA